jgi:hypothetical protein
MGPFDTMKELKYSVIAWETCVLSAIYLYPKFVTKDLLAERKPKDKQRNKS